MALLQTSLSVGLRAPSSCFRLDLDCPAGYTFGMKTAVSVPDEVFEEAEHLAKRLKISRSQLYSKALSEFVSRYAPDAVTDSFNRVCAEIEGEPDPAFQRAARKVLESTEW
jgi:predicted transcriptional regulator